MFKIFILVIAIPVISILVLLVSSILRDKR